MEIFELRYFLGVAQTENVHKAADRLNVSPCSLSKAIAWLESELGVKLFNREGRRFRLSYSGLSLQEKASEIVHLEETAKSSIAGAAGSFKVDVAGPEVLLAHFGMMLTEKITGAFPHARFEFHSNSDTRALEQIRTGESHVALVTVDPPPDVHTRILGEAAFHTFVGRGHPLYAAAAAKKTITVDEVLTHGFVSSRLPLLGSVGAKQSTDGWRDDKFPRRVHYLASSLKVLMEEIVSRGLAVAYLPDYLPEYFGAPLAPLKISSG